MDHIKSQLDKITELSEEELSELSDTLLSEFKSFDNTDLTPEALDAMEELADMREVVRGEVARREAQQKELAARAAEASARIHGTDENADDEEESDDSTEEEAIEASAATDETSEEVSVNETPENTEPAETTEFSAEDAAAETPVEAEASAEDIPADDSAAEEISETVEEAAAEEVVEPEAEVAPATEAAADEDVAEAPVAQETEASAEDSEDASEEEANSETEASAEVEESTEAAAETPVEAEASNTEETPIEPIAQEEATVTAAAEEPTVEAPADRRPVAQVIEAPVAITAGADIPGYTAGSKIEINDIAEAMTARLRTLRNVNGGDGEQHIVASVTTQYPESRELFGTPEENQAKIDRAMTEGALVASGGFGTPVETRYDIYDIGSTDARPIRDSLPKFRADRGGVRFVRPPVLSSYVNATGVWTEDNDIDAADNDGSGTDVVKNSLTVAGATEAIAMTDAITLQLQFGNLLTRAYPELVARHNELALVQHAREAELNLLAKINAASTAVTTSSLIGFARDFLVNVRRAAAAYRSRHRIDPERQLQVIVPLWVFDAMAADLALNMPGDNNLSVAKSTIRGWLAALNVTLTASYDQNTFSAQGAGALLEFPDSFTWFLFSEGSFLFLDGGTLDIGIVRDSGLVGTNDYKMFIETFEGLAFVGIESLAITSTIAVNGAAAALRDTTGGATAAAAEF